MPYVFLHSSEQEYIMQRAILNTIPIHFQSQATRVLPGHGTGLLRQAVNDDEYCEGQAPIRMFFAVLANVIGGALLLWGMLFFPHLLAGILS